MLKRIFQTGVADGPVEPSSSPLDRGYDGPLYVAGDPAILPRRGFKVRPILLQVARADLTEAARVPNERKSDSMLSLLGIGDDLRQVSGRPAGAAGEHCTRRAKRQVWSARRQPAIFERVVVDDACGRAAMADDRLDHIVDSSTSAAPSVSACIKARQRRILAGGLRKRK